MNRMTIRTTSTNPRTQIHKIDLSHDRRVEYTHGDDRCSCGWYLHRIDGARFRIGANAQEAMDWLKLNNIVTYDTRWDTQNERLSRPVRGVFTVEHRQLSWIRRVADTSNRSHSAVMRDILNKAMEERNAAGT